MKDWIKIMFVIMCWLLALPGCGVRFSVNFAKQDSTSYPAKTMSGNVSGRSSNPKEFKDILSHLGFEVFEKSKEKAQK